MTHADLFFENPVKLPFLNIELPLLAFFFVAPILFLIVHAYTLVHLVMLTEKTKRFHQALYDPERHVAAAMRETLQWQLPSNIFIQFLAGPKALRGKAFGWALRSIAWITLAIAPVLLLLMMQIQFLPYHSLFIAWTQRIALLLDLILLWWLWRRVLSGRELDGRRRAWARWAWTFLAGLPLTLAALLFSGAVATFPGEWQEDHLPSATIFPGSNDSTELMHTWGKPSGPISSKKVSLHDFVFDSEVDPFTRRRWLPFSSTLVLPGLNVYEGLGIDDPEKVKGRDFVFRARGRDLKGAILDFAVLPKVDFEGAHLERARLERRDRRR